MTKILVLELPTNGTVEDVLNSLGAVNRAESRTSFTARPVAPRFESHFTAPTPRFGGIRGVAAPRPEWGIAGQPADTNKIFGAGFEIDEPRARDYRSRYEFESDHAAFDRFVEAGEDCAKRGLIKKSNAPITKVNAIRKRIEDGPVFGRDLIGETDWF